ncbi:hypothetical protein FRB90_002616 [Tulasnella sp. 427]|nr:hypothetical protein FRB90_002616 [Tulasnella sp. 427]
MSKTVAFVWRNAIHSFNHPFSSIPACPSDFNEVRWTRLLFTEECTVCGAESPYAPVDWNLRLRSCTNCFQGDYVSYSDIQEEYPKTYEGITELIPFSCFSADDHHLLYHSFDVKSARKLFRTYQEISAKEDIPSLKKVAELIVSRRRKVEKIIEFGAEMKLWESDQKISETTAVMDAGPSKLSADVAQPQYTISSNQLHPMGGDILLDKRGQSTSEWRRSAEFRTGAYTWRHFKKRRRANKARDDDGAY